MSFTQTTITGPKLATKPLDAAHNANPPMSLTIDTHFSHLSSALDTLIKSLSTYNPTPSHAQDLVLADAELNKGLSELHTHQTNHSTLLTLRAQSQELDTQIKETLILLTSTRSEVLNTPGTPLLPTNPVSYSELLSYARRISRTTLPQSYREPTTPPITQSQDETTSNSNGNSTPITTSTPVASAIGTTNGVAPKVEVGGEHSTKLPKQFEMATTLPDGVFTPWPQDTLLRRGALATIQVLIEKGDGLEGEGGTAAGEGSAVGGAEDLGSEQEKEVQNIGMGDVGMMGVGGPVQQQQRPQGVPQKKKAAFELETFEDDDEEEDD